jgi:hypothetical protein
MDKLKVHVCASPLQLLLAEIYLQCHEDSNIYKLLIKHKLLEYLENFQYVESLSACVNTACTDNDQTVKDCNSLQSTLVFPLKKKPWSK